MQKEDENIVFENINMRFFEKIKYYDFENWLEYRISKDKKYFNDESFYSIRVIFNKQLLETEDKNLLENLKPKYPWKKEIMSLFEKKSENSIKKILMENKILKHKIKYFTRNPLYYKKHTKHTKHL